ncbi:MAG TPA: class IV adenylate cyclase [Alphaproteobacteria bacterium]
MQEIEILVELHDPVGVALEKLDGFLFKGIKETHDVYYTDPLRDYLQWDGKFFKDSLRIREQGGKSSLNYKINHHKDGKWFYADEFETEIGDAEQVRQIITRMGLQELVAVHTKRYVFIAPLYEITIDDVQDLGVYMEVEYKGDPDPAQSVDDIKAAIMTFMQSLGLNIGPESKHGKPEMMLLRTAG